MRPRQVHTNSGSGNRSEANGGTGSGIEAASRVRRIRRTAPFGSVLAPDATATPYSWRRRSLVCWSSSCQTRHQVESFLSEAGSSVPSASRARAISPRATRSSGLTTLTPTSQSRRRASSESTPAGTARSLTRVACRPKASHSHPEICARANNLRCISTTTPVEMQGRLHQLTRRTLHDSGARPKDCKLGCGPSRSGLQT